MGVYTQQRARAVELLQHYFELIGRRAGIQWHADNNAELEELADALIEAAADKAADDMIEHYLKPEAVK